LIFENLSEKHLSVIPNIKGFRPFPEVICPTRIRKVGFVKLNLGNNLTFWDGWKVFFQNSAKIVGQNHLKLVGLMVYLSRQGLGQAWDKAGTGTRPSGFLADS
jgi:hypothetical protein